ncbi:MAG: EAL domain-containing protein [Methylococcales bacterium]|nr:EAL domain-containing protein [Methylococcales bacterium]
MTENQGLFSNSSEKMSAIEEALRSASLLELSSTIATDLNFIRDLESIYRLTRFSIDIDTCVLFLFVDGLWWEAKPIIQNHKFIDQCHWEKVDKDQFSAIESLFKMQQDVAINNHESNDQLSMLRKFLSQGNIHFERFKTVHGGVAFKPTGDNTFSQYDHVFLSYISVIISFCVDKDISSRYLKDVYQSLEKIAYNLNNIDDQIDVSPALSALYVDSETGLVNKLGFLKVIEQIVKAKQLNSYIVILSVEKTGAVLDLLHEKVKVAYLNEAVIRFKSIISDNITLAHIGAYEFGLVIPNAMENDVRDLLKQIMDTFQNNLMIDGYKMNCTLSAGYSCFPNCETNSEELLRMTYIALFQAKASISNKIVGYESGIVKELQLHLELARSLPTAIENKEFVLFLQPIVSVNQLDEEIKHYEALIRWQHPEKGFISPLKFIDIAEKSGDIVQIGYWVIEEVCCHLSQSSVPDFVGVSVNLSPIQLKETDLVKKIIEILNKYKITSNRITIEITESSAMQNSNLTLERFSEFHSAGFILSMDDFGTGYSSLSYLLMFPFDILKVDKSFIDNTLVDENCAIIGRAVVRLAHDLSLSVICEGIETEKQLQMIESWNTDMIQGYLISKPKPWSEFYQ